MNSTAAIAGATGLTGQSLLKLLEHDKRFSRLFVLSRKSIKTTSGKTELILTDFEDQNWKKAFPADVFFCCLGTTMKKAGSKEAFRSVDFDLVLQLASLAKLRGCRQFIGISSLGANKESSNFYLKTKGQIEAAITQLGFESCTFVRPSLLLGSRNENRPGEKIGILLTRLLNPLLVGPLKKYRGISSDTVAAAMLSIATEEKPGTRIIESDQLYKFS
jgi:uncharacterized protein YbjT (DUF2867 family)